MTLKIENSREAFLSVLSVVASADEVGSLEERDFLFQTVKALDLFAGMSQADFNKLLGSVTEHLYENLPTEGGAIGASGVDELLLAVKSRLSGPERSALLEVAGELAAADDESGAESALLSQLRAALKG